MTSGQELEEVDISVHCDIKIFDWLLCWIKYDKLKVYLKEEVISSDPASKYRTIQYPLKALYDHKRIRYLYV